MKFDWKTWVIFGCIAVIVILWLTRPQKQTDNSEVIRLEQMVEARNSEIAKLRLRDQAREDEYQATLAKHVQKMDSIQGIIKRLQTRLRKIDTSKANAADLDSILNELYP